MESVSWGESQHDKQATGRPPPDDASELDETVKWRR